MRALLAVLFVVMTGVESRAKTGSECTVWQMAGYYVGDSCYRKCNENNTCFIGSCFEISVKRYAIPKDDEADANPTADQLKTMAPFELKDNKGKVFLNRFNICMVSRVFSFLFGDTWGKFLAVRRMENISCFASNDFGSCITTLTISGVCVAGSCQRTCRLPEEGGSACTIGKCYAVRKDFHMHVRAYICVESVGFTMLFNLFTYSHYHLTLAAKARPIKPLGYGEVLGYKPPASEYDLELYGVKKEDIPRFQAKQLTADDMTNAEWPKPLVDMYYQTGFTIDELKKLGWGQKTLEKYTLDLKRIERESKFKNSHDAAFNAITSTNIKSMIGEISKEMNQKRSVRQARARQNI